MNLNFGDLIDVRTRAYAEEEEVSANHSLNFPEEAISAIENAVEFVLIETSYLPHLYELQSYVGLKPFFSTSNFNLYKIQGKLLCICFNQGDFASFLSHLLPSLKESKCTATTISLNPLNNFKTDSSIDSCILRCLSSSKIQGISQLESPNFITGLSATIATYGKFYDFPFTSYILYTNDLDQYCVQKLSLIFEKLSLSLNLKPQIVSNANSLYI